MRSSLTINPGGLADEGVAGVGQAGVGVLPQVHGLGELDDIPDIV